MQRKGVVWEKRRREDKSTMWEVELSRFCTKVAVAKVAHCEAKANNKRVDRSAPMDR